MRFCRFEEGSTEGRGQNDCKVTVAGSWEKEVDSIFIKDEVPNRK